MNYEELLAKSTSKRRCRVGIIGANGGFGYSFLAQIPLMKKLLSVRLVCDLSIEKSIELLLDLGYSRDTLYPCYSQRDMDSVPEEGIILLDNSALVGSSDIDVMVEATGQPELSAVNAEQSILGGKHVCMVSKESDCVSGPYLYRLAKERGLVYAICIGDQPANLINWISYIEALGMEIICAGKSSEYDFVYDLDSGDFAYRGQRANIPELKKYWKMGDLETTLKERSRLLADYPQFAVPDYCEMNVVCNATGLVPSTPHFHYPMINVKELADVYIPREEGGVLEKTGVVDSFNCFRRPDEVSFAGGVFVIVKCHNEKVWDILDEKGHVVGRNKHYGALFLPYHYMGVEAPASILEAYYCGLSSYHRCDNVATMACRAKRDFKKGEVLTMTSAALHRIIEGMDVTLEATASLPENVAPYYLITDKKLVCDVKAGTLITQDMVDLSGSALKRMIDSMK